MPRGSAHPDRSHPRRGATLKPEIVISYNGTDTLTLTGPDTIADYQAVLKSVTFSSSDDPTNGGADLTRTITWVVKDNFDVPSSPVTTTIGATGGERRTGGERQRPQQPDAASRDDARVRRSAERRFERRWRRHRLHRHLHRERRPDPDRRRALTRQRRILVEIGLAEGVRLGSNDL